MSHPWVVSPVAVKLWYQSLTPHNGSPPPSGNLLFLKKQGAQSQCGQCGLHEAKGPLWPGELALTAGGAWNRTPGVSSSDSVTNYMVKFLSLKLSFLICQTGIIVSTSQVAVRNKWKQFTWKAYNNVWHIVRPQKNVYCYYCYFYFFGRGTWAGPKRLCSVVWFALLPASVPDLSHPSSPLTLLVPSWSPDSGPHGTSCPESTSHSSTNAVFQSILQIKLEGTIQLSPAWSALLLCVLLNSFPSEMRTGHSGEGYFARWPLVVGCGQVGAGGPQGALPGTSS